MVTAALLTTFESEANENKHFIACVHAHTNARSHKYTYRRIRTHRSALAYIYTSRVQIDGLPWFSKIIFF